MAPLLSFAIPTYNFGGFIGETIQSIQEGMRVWTGLEIEIVILDGGSTDNTEDVVGELCRLYKNIRYIRNERRGGIDKDLDSVIGLARGQYIWLFSADDLLEPGWDIHVAKVLKGDFDILLVPAILCTIDMRHLRSHPIFDFPADGAVVEMTLKAGESDVLSYLHQAKSLEAFFSFMSSIVVKASSWRQSDSRADYFGSCWAHCARLIPLLLNHAKIKYLSLPLIQKRGENDSFMEHGFVHRIGISVDGWSRLIEEFFPEKNHKKVLYSKLRRDISLPLFLYAKISVRNPEESLRLAEMARQHYFVNSPTLGTRVAYALFKLFPKNRIVFQVTNYFFPNLVKIRHKIREIFA